MSSSGISFHTCSHVGRIILSRPPHNYFNWDMISQIADLIESFDADPVIRAYLITSNQKHFCAGADFSEGNRPDPRPIYQAATRLAAHRKPLVAAVRGAAVGGGLGLALTADIRMGSTDAWFQANFVKIGLSPGFGLSHTLPRLVGEHRARELFLTGRRVDAGEALSIGMIDRLVSLDDLDEAAMAFARDLAESSPAALHATRQVLADHDGQCFAAAVESELSFQRPLFASPDFDEGVAAARERRTPVFADCPGDFL
jgi:enoyl-CoA hydratase/carnithine racemase